MSTHVMSPGDLEAQLEARLAAARARPTATRARPIRERTARRAPRRLRGIATVAAVGALTVLGAAVTLGVHDAGFVEMDGNVVQNAAVAPPYDWNTLFDSSGGYIGPAGHQFAFATDYPTPDYTYHAGSDKDQADVSTWECGDVNNPTPKDEILNAYAVLSTGTGGSHVGDTILNFGFERPVNNGTSFMGVWFFQSSVGCDSAPTGDTISFTGAHSLNDILTLVNFTNGGAQFSIEVYRWVGTGGAFADGTMDLITSSGECGPSEGDARVCGKVNTDSITTNWPPGDGGLAVNQFFEGGLNINDLLAPEGQALPCFSTFMAETRTSDVFTAQLKDFAFGALNSCGEVDAHKYLDINGNGSLDGGEGGLDDWTIDLYNDDGTTPGQKDAGDTLFDSKVTSGGGDAAFTEVPAGDYIVCEQLVSDSPPWVNTDPGSASAAGPLCKALTVTAGESSTTNFGNGQPNIDVSKTPSVTDVCNGGTVTYTYVVTNTGNVDLTDVSLSDDKLGTVGTLASLAAGADHTFTATSAPINGEVDNTVTATGNWDGLTPAATADASAIVNGHTCDISLTKTPSTEDVCNDAGAQVTYTYVITNNSDFFGVSGALTDDQFGSVGSFGPIAAGDSQTLTNTVTVNGTVTNVGTADGTFDDTSSTTAQATATATVTGHDCSISLTKTPDITSICSGSSAQVTYTYVVTNESDFFNVSGTVSDDQLGSVGSFGPIGPGGTATLQATTTVNDTVTNTGTADGTFDDSSSTTAQATATATVTAHDCTISLTKTPSTDDVCNDAGSQVTYTYVITNNSDTYNVSGTLTDDQFGSVGSFGPIAPGDSQTLTKTATVNGTVTNIGTADGTFDDASNTTASATATATVTGHDCDISLTKTPSTENVCNDSDSTVTYTYVVTNNSDFFNVSGTVSDDVLGSVGSFGPLGPGDSATLTKDGTVNGTVTNIGTADGTFDDSSSTTAQATATATVTGHDCDISLTKTPDQATVCDGTTVVYTYVVTNNSDFFTWTGTLTDDKLGAIDGTIVLGPGDSQTFTASTPITGDVINTATASGTFNDDPTDTTASAEATAEVIGHPCGGQGCTPGFWQGGVGIKLWNTVNDPDWTSHGGLGTNPFIQSQKFNSFFLPTGNNTVDNMTMLQIVGSGGTNVWARKAARDLIAAYLNSSFLGSDYPYSTATILDDWADAVAGGTAGFQAFHAKYSAANALGCPIGNAPTVTLAIPRSGLLALASALPIIGIGVLRRRRRR